MVWKSHFSKEKSRALKTLRINTTSQWWKPFDEFFLKQKTLILTSRFCTRSGTLSLQGKFRMYRFIKAEYLEIANLMRAYCRKEHKKDSNLLRSIPGIGGYLASVIIAECGDIRKFNTEGQFASFIGLVPGAQPTYRKSFRNG